MASWLVSGVWPPYTALSMQDAAEYIYAGFKR